jgi:hypothetical protein
MRRVLRFLNDNIVASVSGFIVVSLLKKLKKSIKHNGNKIVTI